MPGPPLPPPSPPTHPSLSTSYTTVLLKWVEWKFWMWLFYKNTNHAFNEGLPYITHFIVLHQFLRRPHNLLTFIRHLTLIEKNLIKQKNISLLFRIKFKQFHILVHLANCSVYLHYLYIFHCNDFERICVYLLLQTVCRKIFFIYFLQWCIVYFALYPVKIS